MDFDLSCKEYNIVINKTFHLMENVSLEEYSTNESSPAPSAEMMTFNIFLFLIVEILGNFLLLSMITYEKYGMDPQKRNMTNQLLSSICISFLIHNIIAMPIVMFHRIYHPFLITQCKKKNSFLWVKEFIYTRVRNVCLGWSVYVVKCLYSHGPEWEREGSHSQ